MLFVVFDMLFATLEMELTIDSVTVFVVGSVIFGIDGTGT
jgi:hypothetical protein